MEKSPLGGVLGAQHTSTVIDEKSEYTQTNYLRILVEGDTYLLDEVVAQLNYNNYLLTRSASPLLEKRVAIFNNLEVNGPDKKVAKLDPLKVEFIDTFSKSAEGIINSVNYNNTPILRIYLHNSLIRAKSREDEVRKIRNFITSNYDKTQLEAFMKIKPKSKEEECPVKTPWAIFCVGRVTRDQQKRIPFVFFISRALFYRVL